MNKNITILDYGAGNLRSVSNSLEYIGIKSQIAYKPEDVVKADILIVPGVGAFGAVMEKLRGSHLDKAIHEYINSSKPFLGICIGLQILFEKSEESPGVKGLGVFRGEVLKFSKGKVPQIGWNKIEIKKIRQSEILKEGYAYFVNSYYVSPGDNSIVLSTSFYHQDFVCAVSSDNITAVQFHPEKSGKYGINFLKSWCENVN